MQPSKLTGSRAVRVAGRVIALRLTQPLKAYLPIFSAPAISTLASFSQPAKASEGISLTLSGIATALRALQPAKAPAPIVSTPFAIVNVLRALTSLNAPTPITLTFAGIATEATEEPAKALSPIFSRVLGRRTVVTAGLFTALSAIATVPSSTTTFAIAPLTL